jgi:hypothetical protein
MQRSSAMICNGGLLDGAARDPVLARVDLLDIEVGALAGFLVAGFLVAGLVGGCNAAHGSRGHCDEQSKEGEAAEHGR